MIADRVSRRGVLGVAVAAAGMAATASRAQSPAPAAFDLLSLPTRVFKTADRSHENTESWIFYLIIQTRSKAALTPTTMKVDLLKGGVIVRSTAYPNEGLKPLLLPANLPGKLPDGSAPPTPLYWPYLVRIRATEPIRLGVDAMRIEVEAADEAGGLSRNAVLVPIETYEQKTSLIFPFRGKAVVLQGGATNGGHRNRSGCFAVDAFGLDDSWSVQSGDGKKNTDYPGWGRALIAPADGVVVRARADRPDQPVGDQSDPKYYAPEHPNGGDTGNYLVIDHGGGEFSMMAHFQAGSMLVKAGERVRQGQPLGKLGHSGDTNAPHLHYQLQAGPDWENADGLPCRFTNVSESILDRGTYFEAT